MAFVRAINGQFWLNSQRFPFIGFNAYDLGVTGTNSSSLQLSRLQEMQRYGATVVRTWAYGNAFNASPQAGLMQYGLNGGSWNESAFVFLDNAIANAASIGMKLILTLCNNYDDFGGKPTYVKYWNHANSTSLDTTFGDNFHDTAGIITLFEAFLTKILNRTNTVSGIAYKNDPTIFAWEVGNEFRYTQNNNAGTDTNPNTLSSTRLATMTSWWTTISAFIKGIDSNHLLGTGSINQAYDYINTDPVHNGTYYGEDFLTQHSIATIDYADFHLYAANGYNSSGHGVADCTLIWPSAAAYQAQLKQYLGWAQTMGKPLVVGEIGIDKRNTLTNQGVPFYPRSAFFSDLFTQIFPTNSLQHYGGALLWNYDNPGFPDVNFGIDAGITQTDPTVGALNTTDTALLAVVAAKNQYLAGVASMATFTTTQCNTMCDNIAQTITDALALLPANITGINTDYATEVTRIQSFTDSLAQSVLESAYTIEQRTSALANLASGNLITWLSTITYTTLLQKGPGFILDALDFVCSQVSANTGLANYLLNNTLVVDQYFADAFNQFCLNVASGAFARRYGTSVPAPIPSAQIFTHANVDTLNVWTATGASTGNLTAGTASLAVKSGGITAPGGGTVEAYAGGTIGASTYTITVTYTNNLGVAGQTFTVAVPSGTTVNTVLTPTPNPGPNVASIQSIAVTTGSATNADIVKFRLKPVRVIAA